MARKHGRGKIVAWTLALLTTAGLAALALTHYQGFLERWHLRKLDSGSDEEKLAALEKLTVLRSRKMVSRVLPWTIQPGEQAQAAARAVEALGDEAVLPLLDLIRDGTRPHMLRYNASVLLVKVLKENPETLLLLLQAFDEATAPVLFMPLDYLLHNCEEVQAPVLLEAISRKTLPERQLLLQLCAGAAGQVKPARQVVLSLLRRDPDPELRFMALQHLVADPGTPLASDVVLELIRALGDPSMAMREAAAWSLARTPAHEAKEAEPALVRLLEDAGEEVRSAAAQALGRISPARLIEAARRGSVPVKLAAVPAISAEQSEEGVEALVALAREDPSEEVSMAALASLGAMGERAGSAVPALLEAARKDSSLRRDLIRTLGMVGKRRSREVLPTLIELVRGDDSRLRLTAVNALMNLGPECAADTVPVLAEGLADPDLGGACGEALGGLGKAGVGALRQALARDGEATRRSAAEALGRIGPEAREAVPDLVGLLRDREEGVRLAALEALMPIRPPGPDVAAALEGALEDREHQVRLQAALVLVELAPERCLPALKLFEEVFAQKRFGPVTRSEVLAAVIPLGTRALPLLTRALEDSESWIRARAADLLGELGTAATGAIPALEKAARDPEAGAREAAARALKTIREATAKPAGSG